MAEEHKFIFFDDTKADFELESQEKQITPPTETYNQVDFEGNLNEEQLQIINNLHGPMLCLAGAGSGKTRTIVYAVAKLLLSGVKPNSIMLVTFTNKAAGEMIERLEQLLGKRPKGIWAGTFHAIANRFLRRYHKTLGLPADYSIIDEADARALMRLAIDEINPTEELEERFPTPKMAKSILSYSINCNKTVEEVIAWKYSQFQKDKVIEKLKEVFQHYKRKKTQNLLVDFDDLLVYWSKLLDEQYIAEFASKKIKYILVDEYQDTNYIQDEIIYKLTKYNPDKNVMVVGDDAQSIYAFRGANFENILKFPERYENCKIYRITKNYRSVPQILDLANDSIAKNEFQHQKEMEPVRRSAGVKPYLVKASSDKDQAKFIANQVLTLRDEGIELHDMAVLVRAGFHTAKIELEFQGKNIPYEVRAGLSFFERRHIKDVLNHLKILDNPYDEIAWVQIIGLIPNLGQKSAIKIYQRLVGTDDPIAALLDKSFYRTNLQGQRINQEAFKDLQRHIGLLYGLNAESPPSDAIKKISVVLEEHFQVTYENWHDRLEDIDQLATYAQNYETIRRFLEVLTLNQSTIAAKTVQQGNQDEEEDPIIISTIHRAKGLEWRVVFVPMLNENHFPSSRVIGDEEAIEEERRVFYVAITRAKDQLYLISPAVIVSYQGFNPVRKSRFIKELDPTLYQDSSVEFRALQKTHGFSL